MNADSGGIEDTSEDGVLSRGTLHGRAPMEVEGAGTGNVIPTPLRSLGSGGQFVNGKRNPEPARS
jgi:hypothetical protein